MKLRIRDGKTTHKLDVDQAITYGELKRKLSALAGFASPDVKLSMNKQVRLTMEPAIRLQL